VLQKLYAERKDKALEMLMVSIDDEAFRVPLFLKKNPSPARVLLADQHTVAAYDTGSGIPLIVLIDKNGMLRYRKTVPNELVLQQSIDALLSESGLDPPRPE
jgi:hypothetical protein